MLINQFTCPNCEKVLRSAAGVQPKQKVKCPRCQESFAVSAPGKKTQEEEPEENAAPRRSRREENDEPRPRKKKQPRKKSGNLPLLLGLGGGALVLLLAGGLTWWLLRSAPANRPEPVSMNQPGIEMDGVAYKPLPKLGAQFKDVFLAVTADGAVRALPRKLDEKTLRNLLNPADGQAIAWDKIPKQK